MGRGRRKTKGHYGSSKARTGNSKHKQKKQIPPPDTAAKNNTPSPNKKPQVEIPTSIIVAHIIPFLSRNTWNNVAMANKELK
jgi:hypothetical protein